MIQVRSRPAPAPFRQRLTVVALATTLAVATATMAGHTQSDGTGADTSTVSTECVIHRADTMAVPGAALPDPERAVATPSASPVAIASPVAATPVPDGVPVDPNRQVLTDIETTVGILFTCFDEGEFGSLAHLISATGRGAMFGIAGPLDAATFAGLAATLPVTERTLLDQSSFTVIDETTVAVDVTYTSGSQLFTETWIFVHQRVDGLPAWALDSTAVITPVIPEGAATITIGISDEGYSVEPDTVSGPDVVLQVSNASTSSDHEALVLQLAEGVSTSSLLQTTGGTLPTGVTLIGQATVAPGGEGQLVLVGLAPGTYTIVDLLTGPDGLPNLSRGMTTTFTIED